MSKDERQHCGGMCARDDAGERWTTARHEAGHAVAAFHYETPIEVVSIEPRGDGLGTTRLGIAKAADAVTLFSGPLSEKAWEEFRPGVNIPFQTVGSDHEALLDLQLSQEQCSAYANEAVLFLSNPEVQAQVDRLAAALLERITLTAAEAKEIAGFRHSLCGPEFGRGPENR